MALRVRLGFRGPFRLGVCVIYSDVKKGFKRRLIFGASAGTLCCLVRRAQHDDGPGNEQMRPRKGRSARARVCAFVRFLI